MQPTPPNNSLQRAIHDLWPTVMRIVGVGFMGLMLFIGALLIFVWSQNQPFSDGVTVNGEIVGNETYEIDNPDDDPPPGQEPEILIRYAPIVSYTVDGETYEVEDTDRTSDPFAIGELVEVSYRPTNPADGRVINESQTPLFVGIGFIVAIPLVGLLFLWLLPKLSNNRDRSGHHRLQ